MLTQVLAFLACIALMHVVWLSVVSRLSCLSCHLLSGRTCTPRSCIVLTEYPSRVDNDYILVVELGACLLYKSDEQNSPLRKNFPRDKGE